MTSSVVSVRDRMKERGSASVACGATAASSLWAAMEGLSVQSRVFGQIPFRSPWGIHVKSEHGWFYRVHGGPCVLEVEGQPGPVHVFDGDVVVVTPGREHWWKDCPGRPGVSLRDLLESRQAEVQDVSASGDGGTHTGLFTGQFLPAWIWGQNLSEVFLPDFIHIKQLGGSEHSRVDCLLKTMELECVSRQPYASKITNHLVHALLLEVVQHRLGQTEDREARLLQAQLDPRISRVLALVREHPERPWTVAVLAEHAGMSRSAFCARFGDLLGKAPMEYLIEWRMVRACQVLRHTQAGLKEVAVQVGYSSAAAFGKAFARWAGTTPYAYRRGCEVIPSEDSQNR